MAQLSNVQPYNAADEKHVRSRKHREEREELKSEDAIKYVMASKLGRHFIWELLGMTKMFSSAFVADSTATEFHCGMQNIGYMLQARLEEVVPSEFVLMWKEQLETFEKDAREDESNRQGEDNGRRDNT